MKTHAEQIKELRSQVDKYLAEMDQGFNQGLQGLVRFPELIAKTLALLHERLTVLEDSSSEPNLVSTDRIEPTNATLCIKLAETYAEIRTVLKRDGKGDHQSAQELFDDFKALVYQSCKSDVTHSVFELVLDKIDEVNLEDLPQLEMICRYFSPDNTDHQKQAMLILQSLKEDVSVLTARFNNILDGT